MTTQPGMAKGEMDADAAQRAYAAMLRLRRFEEKAGVLYALGHLLTPCPQSINREAALVAVAWAGEPGDRVLSWPPHPLVDLVMGARAEEVLRALQPEAGSATLNDPRVVIDELDALVPSAAVTFVILNGPGGAGPADAAVLAARGRGCAVLPVRIAPRESPLPPLDGGRAVDGADLEAVLPVLRAARGEAQSGDAASLTVFTPPFMGHARRAPPPSRSGLPNADPLLAMRQRLVSIVGEPVVLALEASARDEISAAARLLTEAESA